MGIVHSTLRPESSHVTVVEHIPVTSACPDALDLSLPLRSPKLDDLCDDLLRRRMMSLDSFHTVVDAPR